MKRIYLALSLITFIGFRSFSQTTLSVDASGILNYPKIIAYTGLGQSFFTGHQAGAGYANVLAIFSAVTDNPTGSNNYFYDGIANGVTNFRIRADGQGYFAGNVGIGTTTPGSKLNIMGGGLTLGTNAVLNNNDGTLSVGNTLTTYTPSQGNWGTGSGSTLILSAHDYSTIAFHHSGLRVDFIRSGNGTIQIGYDGGWGMANVGLPNGIWNSSGNVGIGTTNTQGYKLAVNGSVIATAVNVKPYANWPDYVFSKNYHLPSLADVKTYIDQNHHLQDMPSEKEVAKDGINLGEMNKLLTKKVEELTLYIIEIEKEKKEQQTQIAKQNAQLETTVKIVANQEERLKKMEKKMETMPKE